MKRHATDLVSLIFGLFFLITAAWWYVAIYLDVDLDLPNLGWFLAGGLIVLGLIGVVASLRRDRQPMDLAMPDSLATTAEVPTTEARTEARTEADAEAAAQGTVGIPAERED